MVTAATKLKTLAPWKNSYEKPIQYIKKKRHHFADKGPHSHSYGFSSSQVWCESWAIKKAECRRIDAFELWCWRRLLRVPWTARRSNQSILKEISPEYSLEGLMKLKLQYFGHLTWRADWMEINPDAGKHWNQEEKGTTEDEMVEWHHRLDGYELEQAPGKSGVHGVAKSQTWLSNWTELKGSECVFVDLTLFHLLVNGILKFSASWRKNHY